MPQTITCTLTVATKLTLAAPPPSAIVGQAYNFQLSVSGGTPPYTFSAAGLPAGLTLSSTGLISGTPTAAGNATITIADATP